MHRLLAATTALVLTSALPAQPLGSAAQQTQAAIERIRRIATNSAHPAHRTIVTREAIWAETPQEYAALFPELLGHRV